MTTDAQTQRARAGRNRTLTLDDSDRRRLRAGLVSEIPQERLSAPIQGVAVGDCLRWAAVLPEAHVDLMFLDPPYNQDKTFNGRRFHKKKVDDYTEWLDHAVTTLKPLLKPSATVCICGDWRSSHSVFEVASKHFVVRNRITWEREKGRGAKRNWKNASEDIWFCTMSADYVFNVDAVKLRRRVIAPYTGADGRPKDWRETDAGRLRDTHPSNLWTDITVPFWSMPENTDHPTQKSEKLLAKLLLASTDPGSFVFDPFLGSGTTCVAAKKLGRKCLGIEIDEEYCLWALRRLEMADEQSDIQGCADGVFWERNTRALQQRSARRRPEPDGDASASDLLFP